MSNIHSESAILSKEIQNIYVGWSCKKIGTHSKQGLCVVWEMEAPTWSTNASHESDFGVQRGAGEARYDYGYERVQHAYPNREKLQVKRRVLFKQLVFSVVVES